MPTKKILDSGVAQEEKKSKQRISKLQTKKFVRSKSCKSLNRKNESSNEL